jgi:zinc protease
VKRILMNRLVAVALVAAPTVAGAQGTKNADAFDRAQVPALGKTPTLKLPAVEKGALANGVGIQLVGQHEVPLVQITLVIDGGSRLDAKQPGLAAFAARLLTEGAGSRDANALQSELGFLGASLFANASSDYFSVSLNVPKRSLGAALDLMADVALRPTYKASEVRKQRDLLLASILQRKDQPTQLAAIAFSQLMFPEGHPYHRPAAGDSVSVAGLDSAKVRAFYEGAFVPSRAKLVVVGDVSLAEVKPMLDARFGAWKGGSALPIPAVTSKAVSNEQVKVYLVDKPGAAQSVIYVGAPGADRLSKDYPALMVMNTLLGGSFSSRLNQNLREAKGYTYGINSGFRWSPIPGPFVISSSVRTNVTDSSLVEIFKEIKALRDTPVDATELTRAKNYEALAIPGRFETNGQIAGQFVSLGTFGLPLSSVSALGGQINAVTSADVQRVVKQYVPADKVTVLIVGDLAKIRAGVEALHLGPSQVIEVSQIVK